MHMNSIRTTACLAAVLVAFAGSAAAVPNWGDEGHELTAQIAAALLTPEATEEASKILDGATLQSVATWADKVKHEKGYQWSEQLHYVNTPDWACKYEESYCGEGGCVVSAIRNYTGRVMNQTGEQQQEALKFVIHFCGDIHQPLHVAFASDRGGNSIEGDFLGDSTNLHAVWDFGIIQNRIQYTPGFDNSQQKYGEYLIDAVKSGNMSSNATSWARCSDGSTAVCPSEWADVTADFACEYAYKNSDGDIIKDNFDLGSPYYDATFLIVDEQLAKSGVRMANVLNSILGDLHERRMREVAYTA